MAPELGSGRRKRARPETDEAGSSPAPAAELASSAKKRRLNGVATSSPSTPKGFSALTSAIGGMLGFGRQAGAMIANSTSKTFQDGRAQSVYDNIPGSSDEENAIRARVRSKIPAVNYAKLGLKPPKTREAPKNAAPKNAAPKNATRKSVYDVPSSGDEVEVLVEAEKKEDRNPRKSRQLNGTSKAKTSSGKKTSTRGRAPEQDEEDQADDDEVVVQGTPSKTRTGRQGISKANGLDDISGSGRKVATTKKATVKQSSAKRDRAQIEDSTKKQPPTPKGILTPRHKKLGRPRKSVAFDSGDKKATAEVYFEDLPSKPKSLVPRSRVAEKAADADVQASEAAEDEDNEDTDNEEVCIICSKPDSEPPNEIILCDNCDKAVHQKCYNVPIIPDDDWFCRDCLQEDVVSSAKDPATLPQVAGSSNIPDVPNFEQHLQVMQRVLVDRCSGNRQIKLKGQDEAYEKAFQLVEQTVLAGEGNSMMVIGARGCGKTTLVETIVSNLAADNHEAFHVVRLNGFIHTDDKLALKEIWRQLGKEMDVDDDLMNKTTNYADTLASLLALLSHPSEITGAEQGVTSKSVVFLIDEFDLFATHARQTLLYNLFDIAQARKAPIAVLGLTTRIDVVESLEKRVKSRFSHRYVHLSLPKSLPAYWDICREGLSVSEEDMEAEGFNTTIGGLDEFREYWDQKIETLRKTPSFQDHLEYHFYTTKSVAAFLTTCVLPLSALSPSSLDLEICSSAFGTPLPLDPPDSKLHLLAALSDIDLALLIAGARLDIVAHTDTVNFAMAYDEYSSQMGKQRLQSSGSGMLALGAGGRVWGRAVAGMAWERLVSLGLLIPAGVGGRSNAAHGGLESKMWKLDVVLEEIPGAVELPGFLVKWCTQI